MRVRVRERLPPAELVEGRRFEPNKNGDGDAKKADGDFGVSSICSVVVLVMIDCGVRVFDDADGTYRVTSDVDRGRAAMGGFSDLYGRQMSTTENRTHTHAHTRANTHVRARYYYCILVATGIQS